MKHALFGGLAALTLAATIAFAASLDPDARAAGIACNSAANVAADRHRSRNGIAVVCTDAVLAARQRAAERGR